MAADKTCPMYESSDYRFRARRTLPADPVKQTPAATETKYQCAACGHVWTVQVPS